MLSRRCEVPDHHSGYRYDGRLTLGAVVEHDAEYHHQRQKSQTNVPVIPIAQVKTRYRENDRDPDQLNWPGWPVEPGLAKQSDRAGSGQSGLPVFERQPRLVLADEAGR